MTPLSPEVLAMLPDIRQKDRTAVMACCDLWTEQGVTVGEACQVFWLPPPGETCYACKGECGFQANSTWVPCEVCDGEGKTPPEEDYGLQSLLAEYAGRTYGPGVRDRVMAWRYEEVPIPQVGSVYTWVVHPGKISGRGYASESTARRELKRRVLAELDGLVKVPCLKPDGKPCGKGWKVTGTPGWKWCPCPVCGGTGERKPSDLVPTEPTAYGALQQSFAAGIPVNLREARRLAGLPEEPE